MASSQVTEASRRTALIVLPPLGIVVSAISLLAAVGTFSEG